MDMAEHGQLYSAQNRDGPDWFSFDLRQRQVIKEMVAPTIRRMEEFREKI